VEKSGKVAAIGFSYVDKNAKKASHWILGYAIEEGVFNFEINGINYYFDRRILVYDPNDSGDQQNFHQNAIYYNDTQWAMLNNGIVSTSNGLELDSLDNTAQLKIVIADTNYLNAIDYFTGEKNFNKIAENAYLYTVKGNFEMHSINGTHIIENGMFSGTNTISDDGTVILELYADMESSDSLPPYSIALPNMDISYTITASKDSTDFSLAYENYYLSAKSEQPGFATFEPDGKVLLMADRPGNSIVGLTANDGYTNLPWYTIEAESETATELSLELIEDGVLVTGNDLNDITIRGINDNETRSLSFSTDKESALISEREDELIILVDTDNDGVYDTPITEIPDRLSFIITFNAQGGILDTSSMTTGADGKLPFLPIPLRNGYTFDGWFTDQDGAEKITADTVFIKDTMVYAHWTQNSTMPAVPSTPIVPNSPSGNNQYPSNNYTAPSGEDPKPSDNLPMIPTAPDWINPFTDVVASAWYYDAVKFVSKNGLMNGLSSTRFAPDANLSRAQLAQILYNKEDKPTVNGDSIFTDVVASAWYSDAVTWATVQGIVNGYGNGLFGPDDNITREQLAVMLWRYAGEPAATSKELHFNDADTASGYALNALRWAVENGIINGKGDGILDPKGIATRAQVAQILKNYLEG